MISLGRSCARYNYSGLVQTLREMQAEVRALRSQAEQRVAELHRQRDIERARAAERDPALPLN